MCSFKGTENSCPPYWISRFSSFSLIKRDLRVPITTNPPFYNLWNLCNVVNLFTNFNFSSKDCNEQNNFKIFQWISFFKQISKTAQWNMTNSSLLHCTFNALSSDISHDNAPRISVPYSLFPFFPKLSPFGKHIVFPALQNSRFVTLTKSFTVLKVRKCSF